MLADSATLPIGAVVLMSDGADNSGGIDLDTISDIKRQRIPIHTVGFGRERMAHDIELTDVQMPARSLAKSRLEAQVTFHQWGLKGEKARLVVRDAGKILASRDIVLKGDGAAQTETVLFNAGDAGVKNLQFSIDPLPDEDNKNNNALTRVLYVDNAKPRSPLYGRRAALGFQIYPPRGGRRQEHRRCTALSAPRRTRSTRRCPTTAPEAS